MGIEGAPAMKGTLLQSADMKRSVMEFDEQTIISIGNSSWHGGSAIEASLPEGKRWMHDPKGGVMANGSMAFEDYFAALDKATDVEKRGETELEGKRVTHFAGTVDLEDLNAATGDEDAPAMMPLECWVDESGVPVRIKTGVTVDGETITMTVDRFEFDVPTDAITAPPESETVLESELSEG